MFTEKDQLNREVYFLGTILNNGYPRLTAIIKRETQNDFIIALGYDVSDGKWAQGIYDLPTFEFALTYIARYCGGIQDIIKLRGV